MALEQFPSKCWTSVTDEDGPFEIGDLVAVPFPLASKPLTTYLDDEVGLLMPARTMCAVVVSTRSGPVFAPLAVAGPGMSIEALLADDDNPSFCTVPEYQDAWDGEAVLLLTKPCALLCDPTDEPVQRLAAMTAKARSVIRQRWHAATAP